MMVNDCNVFMRDDAPRHRVKSVKNILQEKNVDILHWPHLNPIENLWHVMKNEVADQHSTNMEEKTAIKIVRTQKMTSEYCCNLIDGLPRRMAAVVKYREDLTKY